MSRASNTAIRIAELKQIIEEKEADLKIIKDEYEGLRKQIVSEMVMENVPQFILDDTIPYRFSLRTKRRWSPVVDNKDVLYDKLLQNHPELFSITAAALTKHINDLYESNNEALPQEYDNLVKCYDDTHVEVRKINRK